MKSLVFPHIINIYDVTFVNSTVTKLYDATWYLTRISETVAKPVARSIACTVFNYCLKKVLKFFWKTFWAIQSFQSSLNASPRSAITFTTETKRWGQRPFPIFFALIDLTG